MSNRYPPRILVLSWLGLIALLGLTVFGAYQPLGAFNTGLALAIALSKALIVATIFMELRKWNALTTVFAGAGFFWLAIMLWLGLADYVTRPSFPIIALQNCNVPQRARMTRANDADEMKRCNLRVRQLSILCAPGEAMGCRTSRDVR